MLLQLQEIVQFLLSLSNLWALLPILVLIPIGILAYKTFKAHTNKTKLESKSFTTIQVLKVLEEQKVLKELLASLVILGMLSLAAMQSLADIINKKK
ncbi:hypothetical protein UFOVP961_22 [uncultured Caudovirales phage]|uniref:Uncharacterized protein n=1 Tax=uncultured Caudovirales phage TaxID=2100421 RepID=A0A6J5PVF4_9CAUD|nr:hypothetical protein UFOVP961_22 [uncultured Caudovirales phage]CAB4185540.1 hypothetical protein UFOVP1123_92 [uncultured Caudovirales phage]CAB4193310.1 hypothetical protein UFOVP1239_58 [uncultured Caudovirales phage]CAB4216150.1 hypothetical protein UFOVP1484_96 [uncultured Caudovirales phage]CAB5230777.1 hypothetical protein UFOVP1577_102 [uncultured Caudovirales phage]